MLDDHKRHALINIMTSPGYQVILDVMEQECDLAERELLNADASKANEVLAAHSKAKSYREFFERFQKSAQREISNIAPIAEAPLTPLEIMTLQLN